MFKKANYISGIPREVARREHKWQGYSSDTGRSKSMLWLIF